MRVGATRDEIGAALFQGRREHLRILDDCGDIAFISRLQSLAERHRLRRDDMHQRPALQAGKYRRVDLLRDRLIVGHHHAAAGSAQCLVRGRRHDMRMAERRRMEPARDDPREMRHIDHEHRADRVGDGAEPREIDPPRIGRSAGDDEARLVLDRQRLDLVVIDRVRVRGHAVLDRVEPFAAHRSLGAVGQMPARIEAQPHDRVAGLGQREHHRAVRLCARMRLDVGETATEQLFRAVDRELLDLVRRVAALIITLARIALGVFVGEDRCPAPPAPPSRRCSRSRSTRSASARASVHARHRRTLPDRPRQGRA